MGLEQIFFGPNETTLTPDDVEKLKKLLVEFKKATPKAIAISGNADSAGQAAANVTVSRKRAEAVQRFLVDNGIDVKTTKVFANGSSLPTAADDTPTGRSANRRVDIVTRSEVGAAGGASPGDSGESAEAPPLLPAQGEMPLSADAVAISATTPWVAGANILAPPRTGNDAEFFVDGRDMMADVADKMRKANRIIYITDWSFNPFIHLVRNPPLQAVDRLLEILQTAVIRGVTVRVMLWDSNKEHMNNHDAEAEQVLEAVGVRVHRQTWPMGIPERRFSHHQKTIIVDSGAGRIAYIGGVDLTGGRWDTAEHSVVADPAIWPDGSHADIDPHKPIFPWGDFYNNDEDAGVVFDAQAVAHRDRFPRQPWHDVHARISGPAAVDVERNFVQRWNFQPAEAALPMPAAPSAAGSGKKVVQIVRSAAPASIGSPLEASIQQAYINAIRMSQHYIYIENQYFTSDFGDGSPVANQVMIALAQRIVRAIGQKQTFRVKILLPVHAEGVIDNSLGGLATQETMHWQYRTLVRPQGTRRELDDIAAGSLVGRVLQALPGGNTPANRARLHQFLGLYTVRNHGRLTGGATVTEQIYVHAKLMIVDDRVVVVGSANINDRSLIGSRDTELSAIIVDNETKLIPIDGKNRFVREYAHNLRLQLWQEHLGLSSPSTILDPIAAATHKLWHDTAQSNTDIYEAVFPNIASNRHPDLGAQQAAPRFAPAQAARLGQLRGHLTLYPLDYLRNEDLETRGYLDEVFTFLESGDGDVAVA